MEINVALAIIVGPDQRILIAKRKSDVHLADMWEFPGGKVEAGETARECAVREVLEEVGLAVKVAATLTPVKHSYPERTVTLHPFLCRASSHDAKPLASTEVRWVTADELDTITFPEANAAIVAEVIKKLNV